jgi:hypothetical protein
MDHHHGLHIVSKYGSISNHVPLWNQCLFCNLALILGRFSLKDFPLSELGLACHHKFWSEAGCAVGFDC